MKIHLNLPIFFMLPILFLSLGARADIYQWKDARGQTHVTTTAPPKNASAQKVTVSEPGRPRPLDRSIAVPSPKAKATGPLPFLQPAASSQVEIYSAPWCGFCKKTKDYFRSKGVAFTEYNVDADSAAAARAKGLNPQGGIPVTVVNGRTIVGFSPSQFDSALTTP